ncbi:hypothetical protein DMH15_31335 [Streptomyces sp. WAC 06725]|uniref:hypothetical protein n=1 Tax=Streptomyces sp. WAC 06725 TaxID=2203209 RepID=UPI000F7478BC|nr:hypothetical protein [Streptomyces sp. WAC 06725]RSO24303.1 hypothetical protein DMH15_31335 [Streptomyces sp. WAC 06725]
MPENDLDSALGIEGLNLANEHEAAQFNWQITLSENELTVVASHQQGDDSYAVLHDRSMTWGLPGSPQYLAVHIDRNQPTGTFRYASERLPLVPLAQQWLVARGCSVSALRARTDLGPEAADAKTSALEAKLAASPGRYEILDHYTDDVIDFETTVLLRDQHPTAAQRPFRVLVEKWDFDANRYTLREGCFADAAQAGEWLEGRSTPLPESAVPSTAQARPPLPGIPPRPGGPRR